MRTQETLLTNPSKFIIALLLFGVMVLMAACEAQETATPEEMIECPTVSCPEPPLYEDLWASSAHADTQAEAFNHWNEDDPPEIPIECAKCHSRPGFVDFLGIDGTTPNLVDQPAPIGTTITCYVCHNEDSLDMRSASFPSGVTIRDLGAEAVCIQCHQGLAATDTVNAAILQAEVKDDDTISQDLAFINSHSISAATPFGSETHGAYEYDGKTYQGRFIRGEEFFSCTQCHDQHTLELQFEMCGECHTIMGDDARDIRVNTTDFDGDGDITEGIASEIDTFHESLLAAIQKYASEVAGSDIAYNSQVYPYFFIDTNQNGENEAEEAVFENQFTSWTPRLLRAAYNYNYVTHDPGAFAHNSRYILQVLYDSLDDVGGNMSGLSRPE